MSESIETSSVIPKSHKDKKISKKELTALYSKTTASAMAGGLVTPFVGLIAVDMGSKASILAWIQSITNLLSTLLNPLFGKLSDIIGRRLPFVITSSLFWILPYIFLGWITNPIFIILITAAVNILISLGTPSWVALQNSLFPPKVRAKLAGNILVFDSIGRLFTLILTGLLITLALDDTEVQHYIWIPTVIALGISVLSILPLLTIKEPKKRRKQDINGETIKVEKFKECLKNKPFRKFFSVSMIHGFFFAFTWPLIPIVLRHEEFLHGTVLDVSLFNAIYAITAILFLGLGGKLSDKFGRTKLIFLNRLTIVFFPFTFIFVSEIWQLLVAVFFVSAISTLGLPSLTAYLFDIIPEKSGGTYIGLFNMGNGVIQFFGSLTCGYVVDALIPSQGYRIAVIIALAISAVGRFLTAFPYLLLKDTTKFPSSFNQYFKKFRQRKIMEPLT